MYIDVEVSASFSIVIVCLSVCLSVCSCRQSHDCFRITSAFIEGGNMDLTTPKHSADNNLYMAPLI